MAWCEISKEAITGTQTSAGQNRNKELGVEMGDFKLHQRRGVVIEIALIHSV